MTCPSPRGDKRRPTSVYDDCVGGAEAKAIVGMIRLRVLLTRTPFGWSAQCLDHDIAAEGRDLQHVKAMFLATLRAQIALDFRKGLVPLQNVPPAPPRFFRDFETSEALKDEPEIGDLPPAYQIAKLKEEFRVRG